MLNVECSTFNAHVETGALAGRGLEIDITIGLFPWVCKPVGYTIQLIVGRGFETRRNDENKSQSLVQWAVHAARVPQNKQIHEMTQ